MVTFHEAQQIIAVTLYQMLQQSEGASYFAAEQIAKQANMGVGAAFVQRACIALVQDGHVEIRKINNSADRFTLEPKGFVWAEELMSKQVPALRKAVPASDRVVPINHNQPEWQVLEQATQALADQFTQGNDFGDLTAEEVEVAQSEVEEIKRLIALPKVRFTVVRERTGATLRWIGEKAAGAAVGKAALALLALIATFFGF